jgi:hypothetical protein
MPHEIAAAIKDEMGLPERGAACAITSRAREEWCLDHWGVKWNASDFSALSSGAHHEEFCFATPWSCPEPIFEALAERFPGIAGVIFGLYEGYDFGLVGSISNGCFSASDTLAYPKLVAVTDSYLVGRLPQNTSAPLLPGELALPITSREDADQLIRNAWSRLRSNLPTDCVRYTEFMTDLHGYIEWKMRRAPDQLLESFVPDAGNRPTLFDGMFRTTVDLNLMTVLYKHLCFWHVNFSDQSAEDGWHSDIAQFVAAQPENQLREWAFDATFRGVRPESTDDPGALRQCLTQYAIQLRRQVIEHIQGAAHI